MPRWLLAAQLVLAALLAPALSYDVADPTADHTAHAIEMDEAGNFDACVASFKAAAKFTPSSEAWNNIGVALTDEANPRATDADVIQEAAAAFEEAIKLDPKNDDALENHRQLVGPPPGAIAVGPVVVDSPPDGSDHPPLVSDPPKVDARPAMVLGSPPDGSGQPPVVDAPPVEASAEYADDEPMLDAVASHSFEQAAAICEEMGDMIDPAISMYGVPLLAHVGGFVRQSDPALEGFVLCLLRAGVHQNSYGPKFNQVPILLAAAQHRNQAIFDAVLAMETTDHNVVFRHDGGERSSSTFMHALAHADPTQYVKNLFTGMDNIELLANAVKGMVGNVAAKHANVVKRSWAGVQKTERGGRPEFKELYMQDFMNAESAFFMWLALKSPNLNWTQHADSTGKTPLHIAAKLGNAAAAEQLLERYPQLASARDAAGKTALELAIDSERSSVIEVFRVAGESNDYETPPRITTGSGEPPLTDTGGWSAAVEEEQVTTRCDIDELTTISADDFYTNYVMAGRPLVLRGFAKDWNVRKAWTKDALLAKYGEMGFTTGPVPYANHFGQPDEKVDMATYVAAMSKDATTKSDDGNPYYIFEDPTVQTSAGGGGADKSSSFTKMLRKDYDWRAPFLEWNDTAHVLNRDLFPIAQQFYIGGTGTGAPIHFHGDAWNVCAYGQRRWYLFKPEHATYSKIPMKEWVAKDLPKLTGDAKPLECMQRAGDVIFVPHLWGHGTYNVQESVGVAIELNHAGHNTMTFLYGRQSMGP